MLGLTHMHTRIRSHAIAHCTRSTIRTFTRSELILSRNTHPPTMFKCARAQMHKRRKQLRIVSRDFIGSNAAMKSQLVCPTMRECVCLFATSWSGTVFERAAAGEAARERASEGRGRGSLRGRGMCGTAKFCARARELPSTVRRIFAHVNC
jgi:hypothetical protein